MATKVFGTNTEMATKVFGTNTEMATKMTDFIVDKMNSMSWFRKQALKIKT